MAKYSVVVKRMAAVCGALLLLCVNVCARAAPVYSLEHIGRRDGLPQTSVRAIAVDRLGFLWVGTETGVARYDGMRFQPVAPPFGSGVVMTLYVDGRNRLWVRWYGKPLTIYDQSSDHWSAIPGGERLGVFGAFLEDRSGHIWVAGVSELLYYDESLRRLVATASFPAAPNNLGAQRQAQQIVLHRDAVWIAAYREVVRYGLKRGTVQRIPVAEPGNVRLWVKSDALWLCNATGVYRLREASMDWQTIYHSTKAQISACEFASDGALWLGTDNAGAIRVLDGSEQHLQHHDKDSTSLADNFVVGVQSDSHGQLWVITPGIANRWAGKRFERFEFSPDSQRANPGGVATNLIVEDPAGVLWMGSEDSGLAKISAFARKARHLLPPSSINSHVRTPIVDGNGNVWMGMNQDGVFRWNHETATWTHFPANANEPTQLPTAEVRALLNARDGTIWAGSQSGGVISRFIPTNNTWRRVFIGKDNPIFNLLELPNGHLIAGRDSLVTDFDPVSMSVRHYPTPDAAPIRASTLSSTGVVYFGTHQGGVMEFTPGRGFGRKWVRELSDINVFCVYQDRYGVLWIGTWGGGLNRLDPKSGKAQVITKSDGLPDGTIFGILPGRHDDLWVSTYSGLARIEHCIAAAWPCKPAISVLDSSNGLPFSEFDAEAAARAPNGELFFGGLEGLLYFDPDKIEINRRPPRLQFAAMYLNDKALAPFWLAGTNSLSRPLELKHNFGSLKIDFSALDLHASANNRFRYRLTPSGDWLALGANAEVVLNNLDAGKHVLEILGTNNDGVWSERSLRLPISVLPPWYRTASAWFFYATLIVLGIVAAVKWRERRLRANNSRLEATVAERTGELAAATHARDEFYANVSHEIRTPLTLLVGTAEAIKRYPDQPQLRTLSDDLVRHSDSLRRYVESLITVSHLQSSPTIAWQQEDVAAYLRNVMADFRRVAGTRVMALEVLAGNYFVRSYPNALDTIFGNLLMNAIRHTPGGGSIRASVTEHVDSVAVAILDSGDGIDTQLLQSLFERGSRGSGIANTSIGYGIGLNLVRQTVLALGGTIAAQNATEGGACFTVTLPRADARLPVASYQRTDLSTFGNPPTRPESERRDTQAGKRRGSILIVEDHDELRRQLAALFTANYRVREAATVASGLAAARTYVPDVVICDVMLPDGQGFDVVAALKSDAITDHISIILLTALADEASRLRGLSNQADLYVTKPFLQAELELQVANLLNQRRRMRRVAAEELWVAKIAAGDGKSRSGKESFEFRMLAALEALYADARCSVDSIANRLAMSRKQLERKTRYCFKCSPKILLNRFRLDKAAVLLQQEVRIVDVALRCGFSSQSHFGALYKKHYGHAPSQQNGYRGDPATSQ